MAHKEILDLQISNLKNEIENKKKVFSHVNLAKLPDGGAKINNKIKELEVSLSKLLIQKDESDASNSKNSSSVLENWCAKNLQKLGQLSSTSTDDDQVDTSLAVMQELNCVDTKISLSLIHNAADSWACKIPEVGNPSESKAFNSDKMLSFQDLNKKLGIASSSCSEEQSLYATSPSFKQHRGVHKNGIQLIEAKDMPAYLVDDKTKKSSSAKQLTFRNDIILSSAKNEAVENIFKSIATCPVSDQEEKDPIGIKTKLLKHQRQALSWLIWRESQLPPGGIYADDMGLGKTLTMIALILKQTNAIGDRNVRNTLVVCVPSILHQWYSEIERHCQKGALKVFLYHDKNRREKKDFKKYNVVITTYNIVLADGKAWHTKTLVSPLFETKWHRVILDEAHTIRNHKTQTAQWMFRISSNCHWAVTGTPIHNDLKDMFCLLKFLQCKPFDIYGTWKKLIKEDSERCRERREALVKSIMYRREKNQLDKAGLPIVELPPKTMIMYELVLSERERKMYDKVFQKSKEKATKINDRKMPLTPKTKDTSNASFLIHLLRLQQACNHPSLLKSPVEDDVTSNDSTDSISDLLFGISSLSIDPVKCQQLISSEAELSICDPAYTIEDSCTKIDKLLSHLDRISKDSDGRAKSVIISQWVSMLRIIASHLDKAGIEYHTIDGKTKADKRNDIANDINLNPSGPKVLLLSLKAGGIGLNLVGANHLFLMDLHWNPALETQATDRIHRVGQRSDVFIHKFVCKDTIEEKILHLQEDKRDTAKIILNNAKASKTRITIQDLIEMFNI